MRHLFLALPPFGHPRATLAELAEPLFRGSLRLDGNLLATEIVVWTYVGLALWFADIALQIQESLRRQVGCRQCKTVDVNAGVVGRLLKP